jgi:formamidopyrimidine-DNA glycosylase
MPELPEVETITRQLNKVLKGQVITDVWTDSPNNLKGAFSLSQFKKYLIGRKIQKTERRGKNILIFFDQDWILWLHMKLTGHLLIGHYSYKNKRWQSREKGALLDNQNNFIHWVFTLKKKQTLVLSDMRKFAKLVLLQQKDLTKEKELLNLGPDPTSSLFTYPQLEHIILLARGEIKKVLMDQKYLSGIGNIYANEILWEAKINPFKKANTLRKEEIKRLFKAITKVLSLAIKNKGTSAEDEAYRDLQGEKGSYAKFLKVYQKEGQPCYRCHSLIKRVKDQNRSTFYCSKCQKS